MRWPSSSNVRLKPYQFGLALASATAFLQVLIFATILGPGRESSFPDQLLYEHLGRTLAATGIYARHVADGLIVPEPLRTIGYPAFLAALFRVAGHDYVAIVLAQGALLATLPVITYLAIRRCYSRPVALWSAWAIAMYPPIAYYAALSLSDFFATYIFTLGVLTFVNMDRHPTQRAFIAGAMLGWAALTRPALLVVGLALLSWLLIALVRRRIAWRSAMTFAIALAIFPSLSIGYTAINFSRVSVVATGPGQALWLGYWQGVWSGRTQNELVRLDVAGTSLTGVEARARELAVDPTLAVTYIEQRRAIKPVVGDYSAQTAQELDAERVSLEFALRNIQGDLAGHITRALTYRTFALWVTDIPVRYEQIDSLPRPVLLASWAVQSLIVLLALVGALASFLRSPMVAAFTLAVSAVWIANLPFLSQPRFSLPAKPILLVLAVIGVTWIIERRHALLRVRIKAGMEGTT